MLYGNEVRVYQPEYMCTICPTEVKKEETKSKLTKGTAYEGVSHKKGFRSCEHHSQIGQ